MRELLFSSADREEAYKISKLLQEKKIRKIAPRLHRTNFDENPSEIIKRNEMKIIPGSAEEFLEILQSLHKTLLSSRGSKSPGQFKEKNNRSGNTYFLDYKLVRGTLTRGFDYYKIHSDPFARAAYIMSMVSEVHPFEDGNGRIARVMMNAEILNKDESKIIIPTVYRDDYLLTLKRLTIKKILPLMSKCFPKIACSAKSYTLKTTMIYIVT